ncbi:MAG: hypothetical protein HY678_07960, partial [Chloroflexi bacterium]|nr:hypothetical protein [Chloroflexota bacterium]
DHRLFLPVWAVLVVSAIIVFGRLLAGSARSQIVSILGIGVFGTLYYAVGRPIELAVLRGHGATNDAAVLNLGPEVLLPLAPAGIVLGIVLLIVHSARARSYPELGKIQAFWQSSRHAGAVYLWLGALLWLHSLAAWFLVGLGTGVWQSSAVDPWLRFVDNVGPHAIIWHVVGWPRIVLACCG